jgi:hypothetical protein
MTPNDFWRAASNWQDVSWNQKAFEKFVGVKVKNMSSTYHPLPEKVAERVRLLVGPNHVAIIKAYLARQKQ